MNTLLIFLIVALGFIGYQLYKRNELKKTEMIQAEENEKQKESDEYLKEKYRHIFLDYREELREYYRQGKEIQEREKQAHEAAKELTSISGFDLLGDDYDVLVNPFTMVGFLKDKNKDNKAGLEHIDKLDEGSAKIYQKAKKESFLTEHELRFLYFIFWKRVLDRDNLNKETEEKDDISAIVEEGLLNFFSESLNRYRKK